MDRGIVYVLTLAFAALLAFLTAWVLLRQGMTIVVVAAALILALVVFGALGALGRRQGR
jgi:FtsH-binding integral membrane protein